VRHDRVADRTVLLVASFGASLARSGMLADAVLASIALPVLVPPRRHDDRLLADGGILDNLPMTLLTERDEGPLVAVNIGMGAGGDGHGRRGREPPQRRTASGSRHSARPCCGPCSSAAAARAAGAVVVTPAAMGVGLLELHQLDPMVESGRAAGRALLDQAGHLLSR